MPIIHFGFYSSVVEQQQKLLTEKDLFPWAIGNVVIRDENFFFILEDLPVFGFLSELYFKTKKLVEQGSGFVLVSDDNTYSLSVESIGNDFLIKPGWGYYSGNITIVNIDEFLVNLAKTCKSAYEFNILILPKSKLNSQAISEIEQFYSNDLLND